MIVRAAKPDEVEAICSKIRFVCNRNCNAVLIEDENGGIGAMAIYDRWTHSAVEMHAYSTGPKYVFNPNFLHAIFVYPFTQQNKKLAIVCTPCDNVPSITLSRFLGFKETYRIRDGWNLGTDMVIQELRREECRFLESNHVVKKRA